MRATRNWVQETCPLAYAKLKTYHYTLEEPVGYLTGANFAKMPDSMRLASSVLTNLQREHGDVTVSIHSDRVEFTRHRTQQEVIDYENELIEEGPTEY